MLKEYLDFLTKQGLVEKETSAIKNPQKTTFIAVNKQISTATF